MAGRAGFEPAEHFCSIVFETTVLNQTLPSTH
jgi:hypothetical protein